MLVFIFLSLVLLPTRKLFAASDRFFKPTEGFIRAKDLPDSFSAVVKVIQLDIKDAFEGSTVHSETEQNLFDLGNKLHIESKPKTIRRRLLFNEGDTLTKDLLLEAEKSLRTEEFLADAIIEVMQNQNGTAVVKLTTYDQWTTVPAAGLQRSGGEWIYFFGPVESNLLGTGQRIGFFMGHDLQRDTRWMDYNNNALFPERLHLAAHSAWLSDGYSHLFSLSKPLETRTDRYAFSVSLSAGENSEYYFFDANQLGLLPDSLANAKAGMSHYLERFDRIATNDVNVTVTRSYGSSLKLSLVPEFNRHERFSNDTTIFANQSILDILPLNANVLDPNSRLDYLLGATLSLYKYQYKTVQNFNNLKWSETIETGWRISTKISQNQKWMGARNHDFYFSHSAVYNNAWFDAFYVNSSLSSRYFFSPQGAFNDGYNAGNIELQYKPVYFTSTFLSSNWSNYFAKGKFAQLLLGEDNGLNGFPNYYYAGQARILFEAEQRFFPVLELGTLVPAFAIFANAGNTFPDYEKWDLNDLHYSLGLGLRLGASKSTQKVVNHLNLSWPIGEKYLSGPTLSIRAKKSL